MKFSKFATTATLAASTMVASLSANAAIITFTDSTAFLAAAGAVQTENFNSSTLGQFADNTTITGFNGFNLTSTNAPGSPQGAGIATPAQMSSDGGSAVDGTNLLGFGENLFP